MSDKRDLKAGFDAMGNVFAEYNKLAKEKQQQDPIAKAAREIALVAEQDCRSLAYPRPTIERKAKAIIRVALAKIQEEASR